MVAFLSIVLSFAVTLFVLWMLFRFVRAHESIAESMEELAMDPPGGRKASSRNNNNAG